MKHTKGPWKIIANPVEHSKYDLHTIWTDDMSILIARTCFAPASKTNAELIAQAPAMYDRLASARAIMQKFVGKVNRGMARSVETYAEMKEWLDD